MNIPLILKQIYRALLWHTYNILTLFRAKKTVLMDLERIEYGMIGDFSPYSTFRFTRDGDWDKKLVRLTDHIVYLSLEQRFVRGLEWKATPHYAGEIKKIESGTSCLRSKEELDAFFGEWDKLYRSIKERGYKSNRELYREGSIKNVLFLLDEVTVNITRDGTPILNSGYHRVLIAKILGIKQVPVRILVTHSLCGKGPTTLSRQAPSGSARPT